MLLANLYKTSRSACSSAERCTAQTCCRFGKRVLQTTRHKGIDATTSQRQDTEILLNSSTQFATSAYTLVSSKFQSAMNTTFVCTASPVCSSLAEAWNSAAPKAKNYRELVAFCGVNFRWIFDVQVHCGYFTHGTGIGVLICVVVACVYCKCHRSLESLSSNQDMLDYLPKHDIVITDACVSCAKNKGYMKIT